MAFSRRTIPMTENIKSEISGAKNIFEVFYSLSTETPPGAFPLWTGEWIHYCSSTYPDFYKKAVKYRGSNQIRVISNTDYENELGAFGSCGAFVIDDVNGHIRLPKITNYIKGYNTTNDIGTCLLPGIPNITGTFGGISRRTDVGWINPTGAFSRLNEPFGWGPSGKDPTYSATLQFNARVSSPVYGASDTVQPPTTQLALYIQVFNHAPMEGYIDVSNAESLIKKYYETLDQKVNDAIETLKQQTTPIPDLTRRVQIQQDLPPREININDGERIVYHIERPCWYYYWYDWDDGADADQMIQMSADIQSVCRMPSAGTNDDGGWSIHNNIVDEIHLSDPSYLCITQFTNYRSIAVPLTPGMYYNFTLGTTKSSNETQVDRLKAFLLPMYNSGWGPLVRKYSVKMSWNKRNVPLTYVSHTDLGVINN